MKPIIRIQNLSKSYRIGTIGTGTLNDDFKRWWYKIKGKEDPFSLIGNDNENNSSKSNKHVWALKNVSFDIQPGEIVGIIGKNGAGKSTLLKIISKVTGPTTGRIDYDGRIGSLLEVGTGFHPDLTGRENVFLNGAILGMTRREIQANLDEIVDFSGCERYIDTPVKRYSSGMTVRLGFAVAAYLKPEILIVDEVLAVGDAEFQKKAIGKMQDVSRNQGRTVLFVSHNMAAVERLCTRAIVIKSGKLNFDGGIGEAMQSYLGFAVEDDKKIIESMQILDSDFQISLIKVNGSDHQRQLITGNKSKLNITVEGCLAQVKKIGFELYLKNDREDTIALFSDDSVGDTAIYQAGHFKIERQIVLPTKLNRGFYLVDICLTLPLQKFYVRIPNGLKIDCSGFINHEGYAYSYKDGGFMQM